MHMNSLPKYLHIQKTMARMRAQ